MRMRVSPGSLWLAYSLRRRDVISDMLPAGLRLANSELLRGDGDHGAKLLMNAYGVRSRFMTGHRVDVQVLAQDTLRKSLHLVVVDCFSDAMMWDPERGIQPPNAGKCFLHRRNDKYKLRFATRRSHAQALLSVTGVAEPVPAPISWRFSVEANRRCYFAQSELEFPMSFDEEIVASPVRRLAHLNVTNSLWGDFRAEHPTHAFVHSCPMVFDVHVSSELFRFH